MLETAVQQLRHHGVTSEASYRAFVARQIQKLRKAGYDVAIQVVPAPHLARVDLGRWILDCDCGAGVAIHPEWPTAGCCACGRIYNHIVYLIAPENIERVLMERPRVETRFWFPTETLAQLEDENVRHRVRRTR